MFFELNNELKIVDRDHNSITQYSTTQIELYTSFYSIDDVLTFNLIRPDGSQAPEVYFSYDQQMEPGKYRWLATISPYHTLNIPGKEEKGRIVINFTLKHIVDGIVQYIKSSPIVRLTVDRSTEPEPTELGANTIDDILQRLQYLESGTGTGTGDHSQLTATSRSLPNQHTIDAIIGLRQEISIYNGVSEPDKGQKTWFNTVGGGDPINEWDVLLSTPLISMGASFTYVAPPFIAPMRLKVVGEILGEEVTQYLYNDSDLNSISGEVILYVDEDPQNTRSVYINCYVDEQGLTVLDFSNTGTDDVIEFVATALEVYN